MKILILSPYPPYPPHGGGTMRIYQILRALAQRHRVTVLTFAPDAHAEQALRALSGVCRVICVRGPAPRTLWQRAVQTLVSGYPDMALRNRDSQYAAALAELLRSERFDIVQAESIEMAGYLPRMAEADGPRRVLDEFNAEFVLQRRAAMAGLRTAFDLRRPTAFRARLLGLAGGAYSVVQWLKLRVYERRVLARCEAVTVVSDDDRHTLQALASAAQIDVVPNGVDTAYFQPDAGQQPQSGAPVVVFSGTLDFRPNVDALEWFVHEVMPLVRAYAPNVRLIAVGRRPAPVLQRMASAGLLELTGEITDTRPVISTATVYVVPMRIGGGVRLKLLEALALQVPVVSTTMGAEGVAGLQAGVHCLLADSPMEFAAAMRRLIEDAHAGDHMGAAGRDLVRRAYDWSVIVPKLEVIYERLRDKTREEVG